MKNSVCHIFLLSILLLYSFAAYTQDFSNIDSLKKRAEELLGYFKIQSYPNEGTVVELKFKIT
jgi:signal transduction histidine kinase